MLLGPLAQRDVLMVDADATLASAAEEMWARRCGSAVVLGPDGKPGIITERDLLRSNGTDQSIDEERVGAISRPR